MATTTTNLGLTKPATTDYYNVAVPNANMDILDTEVAAKAVKAVDYTGTLTSVGWLGSSAPYTQSLTISGLTADDKAIVDIELSSTYATAASEADAWAGALKFDISTDTITATFTKKPTIDLNIKIRVVG